MQTLPSNRHCTSENTVGCDGEVHCRFSQKGQRDQTNIGISLHNFDSNSEKQQGTGSNQIKIGK